MDGLKRVIESRHPGDWIDDQLADIEEKRGGRDVAPVVSGRGPA